MKPATIGLFEGYGGLSMAVEEVFGAELVAYSEFEPPSKGNPRPTQAAARLLAHRRPGIPNLGNITAVDWSAVEVDDDRLLILTGGFPCQDLSLAGARAGLRPGTRSGLWSHMAYAIAELRPDLVVIENVRGLLSAEAACDLEPCPWCVGDESGRPLRALGAVLGDLADLGYDARWVGLRAADVGAPHGRFRVFVLAWPAADAGGERHGRREDGRVVGGVDGSEEGAARQRERARQLAGDRGAAAVADTERDGRAGRDPRGAGEANQRREGPRAEVAGCGAGDAADAARLGRGEGRPEPAGFVGGSDVAVGGDAAVANAGGEAGAQRPRLRPDGSAGIGGRRPDDRAVAAVADTDSAGPQGRGVRRRAGATTIGNGAPAPADTDDRTGHGERSRPEPRDGVEASADAVRHGREGREERDLGTEAGQPAPLGGDPARRVLEWGAYEPAIRRWELILGRPAPAPTQTGAKGGQQLSPRFVEWLMGLDDGWVTDPAIGLTRNEQLARLGNGVVPQQAAAAIRHMLNANALEVADDAA